MANENFYEELDLRYIEIGYNMATIDRVNPGKVPFTIPVLTPQLDTSKMTTSKVIQKDKSKLENLTASAVEVSNLEMSNFVYIEVPRALCCEPSDQYYVDGWLHLYGDTTFEGRFTSTTINLSQNQSGIKGTLYGSFGLGVASINSGTLSSNMNGNGTQTFHGSDHMEGSRITVSEGMLNVIPTEKTRYIPKGKRWAIAFLGGDINLPCVLARLPDD